MKRLAITMGEPGGVGPELALGAAGWLATGGYAMPVLYGDRAVFESAADAMGLGPEFDGCEVVNCGSAEGYAIGRPTAAGGAASADAITQAARAVMDGRADALLTAPISKEALGMAGIKWPGHTEMLAELTAAEDYAMMLMGGGLRVMLVTTHVALCDVPPLITRDAVLRKIRLAARACRMLGLERSRIAVAGLNPHASEGGLFGPEEKASIAPAVADAAAEGIDASGPHPADTVFYRALRGGFDIVLAMYHDQGLGPMKLVGFETGVNVTVGLPIVRTSPDHGTAYDIAWKGMADTRSMIEAARAALELKVVA